MCKLFSLVSNGDGKPLYFGAKERKQILANKLNYESADSHTSIADFFGYKGAAEDKLNKYEYNPLTKFFEVDQLNNPNNDSEDIKKACEKLDFKLIIPELIVKPIINPFKDIETLKVSPKDIKLLKQWASVRDSVRASVRDSVRASVRDSVRDSVWASVVASVGASVGASVWDSVWDSVWAYYSSFFDIKYKHDFSSCVELWEKGIVPSFDGKKWRLHGKGGKVIWEGIIEGGKVIGKST
jgi:hypothetical protein